MTTPLESTGMNRETELEVEPKIIRPPHHRYTSPYESYKGLFDGNNTTIE